jgi:hypothetical protein
MSHWGFSIDSTVPKNFRKIGRWNWMEREVVLFYKQALYD